MLVFNEQNKIINLILGKQIPQKIKYKKSIFNVTVEYDNMTLLYNTFTKEGISLNLEEFKEYENLNNDSQICNFLIEHRFVIPQDLDEYEVYNQILDVITILNREEYIDSFNIFVTTNCNARCFYCFENGIKKADMTEETAEDVVEYIKTVSKGRKISIRWFGGEPLYNIKAINKISNGLKEKFIDFTSYITTNGYLFTPENIKDAKESWNLTYAQITLDGTETVYNKVKNYIYTNDDSPYKTVMNNIKRLLDADIYVKIQINIELYNLDDVRKLIDELANNFNQYNNIEVYLGVLILKDIEKRVEDIKKVYEEYNKLNIVLEKYNLLHDKKTLNNIIRKSKCIADNSHHTLILPNGDLAKCDVNSNDSIYGSIYSREYDKNILNKYSVNYINKEQCHKCFNLPNCNRLKNCPNLVSFRCEDFILETTLNKLKKRVIKSYEIYKEKLKNYEI